MRHPVAETLAWGAGAATLALVVGVEVVDRALRLAPGRRLLGAVCTRTARRSEP